MSRHAHAVAEPVPAPRDPREPPALLLRDLRARREGLAGREAARRLVVYGPNEIHRRGGRRWPAELARQVTHPLAVLLWGAGALAALSSNWVVAVAVVLVIAVNAGFAFVQERQAERAVEALAAFLPPHATVRRDGGVHQVEARELVPGDVVVIEEGDRISADARLLSGAVEVDMSAISGESLPLLRSAAAEGHGASVLEAPYLVFSGTSCTGGEAEALVIATGMRTELGRIAALSERVGRDESPLEHQVRRVAWLIAAVAVTVGLAFLPLGTLLAGLPLSDAVAFAIGLLIGNVPEGLLPTITLALAVGVGVLARRGALVKRLSAVETLGSADVVCTDKTGTLTENRMRVRAVWSPGAACDSDLPDDAPAAGPGLCALARAMARCNTAELAADEPGGGAGDPTEIALLLAARAMGEDAGRRRREAARLALFHFDPSLTLMSTVDSEDGAGVVVNVKGAPEAVLARCTRISGPDGGRPMDDADRERLTATVDAYAGKGLRVLAVARRVLGPGAEVPARREAAERDLTLLGLVAMFDPPRPEVPDAVRRCRAAGIRVIVVTGDHGLTAAEVARRVGIASDGMRIVTGAELDAMSEAALDRLLAAPGEVIFARSSPEAKLRIADALRAEGHVVAMTGDGVNDAPALRRADIGVAMGLSGTDVAREAATMVLTDDNFATIVTAVHEGRRVFANIRKFIFYIFVHATPEVVPFVVFALSGGAVPLPLTALQILAIDLGTETLPALALGREPAEPGLMERPPRRRSEGVITREMLLRAWVLLGLVSAVLVMGGFLYVLLRAGWSPGDPVGEGAPLHDAYLQATTMTFLGIVACQVGTAMAARTDRASLLTIGLFTNTLLLWGIAFEVVFSAALVLIPPVAGLFAMSTPPADALLLLVAFPPIVWGVDEVRRALIRRRGPSGGAATVDLPMTGMRAQTGAPPAP